MSLALTRERWEVWLRGRYEQEVSLRAWLAGWEVALLGTGTTGWPPLDAACTPDDLQAAIPGMYGPQHLTLMRDHVAEARQAPRAPPALEVRAPLCAVPLGDGGVATVTAVAAVAVNSERSTTRVRAPT